MRIKCLFVVQILTLTSVCYAFGQRAETDYGRHVITPFVSANNAGPGYGIITEWMLGDKEKLSVVLPVALCYGYARHSGSHNQSGEDLRPLMVFVEPGFRFYPTTSCGVARYALGANLVLGVGKGTSNFYTNGTPKLQSRTIAGLLLSQSIHFQITPHIRTSIEVGIGIGTDDGVNSATGESLNPLGQASFGIGYRW